VQTLPLTVEALRTRFYPDTLRRDPVAAFLSRLGRVVSPADTVLDLGAGAGSLNPYALRGRVAKVIGVDRDPRVGTNPLLDRGLQADITGLPFRDGVFDVVFSIYVLEHVGDPQPLLSEIARVLRPGGRCAILTPNIYHYVTMVARATPTWFHKWINERRGRAADDTFPTRYLLNSRRALTRGFADAGFVAESLETIEVQPNYLDATPVTYAAGIGFERLVNATEWLAPFRVNLIGIFRKDPDAVR